MFLAQVIVNLNELVIQVCNTSYYEVSRDLNFELTQAWSQAPETEDPDTDKLVLDFCGCGPSYNDLADLAKTLGIVPRARMIGQGP